MDLRFNKQLDKIQVLIRQFDQAIGDSWGLASHFGGNLTYNARS